MKTCTRCKEVKLFADFCKKSNSKDGYQPACKSCMAVSYNQSRDKKKEHYKHVAQTRRKQLQEQATAWKTAKGCAKCEENFGPCLELHHLDPTEKEGDPSSFVNLSFEAFLAEASKCVVLCANCHRKVHAGLFKV
jgi:hypothetical protein